MGLGKVIIETLERFKDANLGSEFARERIKHEILRKYLDEYNQYLVNAEKQIRELGRKILGTGFEERHDKEPLVITLSKEEDLPNAS